MVTFDLSEEKIIEIRKKLHRKNNNVYKRLKSLNPVMVAIPGGHKERLSRGVVCIQDAADTCEEVTYSLYETLTHIAWYLEEHPKAPKKFEANLYGKYYIDNAALRLYPAAEHLAEFIIDFMKIKRDKMKDGKIGKRRISKSSRLGAYLVREKPNNKITKLLQKLVTDENWEKTMKYRNQWVHEQPPTLEGMGIVYKRKNRWEKYGTGHRIHFGGGDKPDWNIGDLIETVIQATTAFDELLCALSNLLFARLEEIKKRFESASE